MTRTYFSFLTASLLATALFLGACSKPAAKEQTPAPEDERPVEEDAPKEVSFDLRLMSFNILQSKDEAEGHAWAEYRAEPCRKMFQEAAPDIICLQECRRTQLNFMKDNFKEYSYFSYAKDGVKKAGREQEESCEDDALFKNGGQRNVIALRTDRFSLVSWGRYWFSDTPDVSSYEGDLFKDGGTPKLTLWLKVKEKKTGLQFYVWDTHFFPHGDLGRKQCGLMSVKRMKDICGETATVFFCGDLNRDLNHADLEPLRGWMKHARTVAPKTDDSPTYTGFRTDRNTWTWIDHIFFRNAEVSLYKVISEPVSSGTSVVSDHFPTYADFTVRGTV